MFIVFEGSEGVGKTTQIELLFERMKRQNTPTVKTREPGGTPFAESIRSLFKQVNPDNDTPIPLTELFLVLAARNEHLNKVIKPALSENKVILCDRFLDSTYVYQSLMRGLNKEIIDNFSSVFMDNIVPDLTFIFTAPADVGRKRVLAARSQVDRFDNENASVYECLSQGYEKILREKWKYPGEKYVERVEVKAEESMTDIHAFICETLTTRLGIKL